MKQGQLILIAAAAAGAVYFLLGNKASGAASSSKTASAAGPGGPLIKTGKTNPALNSVTNTKTSGSAGAGWGLGASGITLALDGKRLWQGVKNLFAKDPELNPKSLTKPDDSSGENTPLPDYSTSTGLADSALLDQLNEDFGDSNQGFDFQPGSSGQDQFEAFQPGLSGGDYGSDYLA